MDIENEVSQLDGFSHTHREIIKDLLNKALNGHQIVEPNNGPLESLKLEVTHLKSKVAMLEEALKMKDSLSEAIHQREEEIVSHKKSKKKAN